MRFGQNESALDISTAQKRASPLFGGWLWILLGYAARESLPKQVAWLSSVSTQAIGCVSSQI
jgi:hypothetical protein